MDEQSVSGHDAATIWYSWTTFAGAGVTLDTTGSDFDTTLGVYAGDRVDALTKVAANDDVKWGTRTGQVSFRASAGTTYRIQLDGANPEAVGGSKLAFRARASTAERLLRRGDSPARGSCRDRRRAQRRATAEPGEPHRVEGRVTSTPSWLAEVGNASIARARRNKRTRALTTSGSSS